MTFAFIGGCSLNAWALLPNAMLRMRRPVICSGIGPIREAIVGELPT